MRGWEEVLLSDYYTISSGLSKPASEFGSGFPFLSFKDVFWNYFVPENLVELVNTTEKEKEKCSVKKGDIFLTRTSEKAEELGLSCVALKDYPEATFNGFTKRLRPKNQDAIDPLFIGFYLRGPFFRAEITAFSNLITRASLNNGAINRLKIILPPIATQERIGGVLMYYNKLIENNLKRIKLLEELAQRTYEEWFVKFTINGEKLEVNKETGLPEGWERKKLGEVAEINRNSLKKGFKEKIKYVDIASVSTGNIDSWTEYNFEEAPGRARRVLKHGDTIWSCVRPNRKSFSIIWEPIENLIGSTGFAVLSPKGVSSGYLYFSITTETFVGYLSSRAGGAAYPAVTSSAFEEAEIIIPWNKIEQDFSAFSKEIFSQINTLKNQNRLLKESRDILLPRLMSGAISVEEAEEEMAMAAKPSDKYGRELL